ncbi:hypothetical protein CAPTEDRAFT_145931, partial [Capitella teleta]|uniref:Uncharacterized protein n=1 Tax=Capitella teleta TaxID=283909 RepID=X1Z4E6_CAPTE
MADEYKSLLSGNFELSRLPDVPSKLIKVYLACTPTDTVQERNALVQEVYPRLREYAREKYGMDFQLVDMRWGTAEEEWPDLGNDRALSLREIEQCQRSSIGPSFVGLIGQRYGERPLPVSIVETDFDLIRSALRHHRNRETRDAWLLDQFYKKDSNAIPPVYLLQTIDSVRENLKPKNARLIIGDKEPEWSEARLSLKRLLQRGVEYCLLGGSMVESDVHGYLSSDLEKECRQGVLFSPDPENCCHIFHRCIVDLKNYVNHPKASKFMEITYNEREERLRVDEEADKNLNVLLEEKISKWLRMGNVSNFSVLWKHDVGIHPELHKEYLEEFCSTFELKLKSMIDSTALTQMSEPLPQIVDEVFQHWLAIKNCIIHFRGREDILEIIRSYAMSSDHKPLVLHGESGSGKTSLIGKASVEVRMAQWLPGEVVTIARFIGLTASSFDVRQILHNICLQLAAVLGRDGCKVPNGYKEICHYFQELLETFPETKNLIILLDSLHMLVPQYNAYQLLWLPTTL